MNISAPFIARPVATILLALGLLAAGMLAFFRLPVAPLPQVDFPTIIVQAQMAGASPDTMAATVATPLERHLGTIADVTEMTSTSSLGSTRIVLQFGLDRNINGAASDVQAAINAARADLPTALRSNPTYFKANPADAPVMVLALTSKTLSPGQIYDAASTVVQQQLSQIDGVGEVDVGGSSLPAVRVELNPLPLFKYGVGLEDVRAALASANADSPKGALTVGDRRYQIYTNDQARLARDYRDLVIAYRGGSALTLADVSKVSNSVENLRNAGYYNGQPAVLVILYRQPAGNIIDMVRQVRAQLPGLEAALPGGIEVHVALDRSTTITSEVQDTEITLLIAVALVVLVVFAFLRDWRATLVPAVAVPVSIVATFGVMYLLGYSLDTLSLMALTIATGFVVDDAIVVLENIARHVEAGMSPMQAAYLGAREVGFTVLSISLSLIAVFAPILLMGGIVGRIFREFAVVLSVAILCSLVVSLTLAPMVAARLLRPRLTVRRPGLLARASAGALDRATVAYRRSLGWALDHASWVAAALVGTIALNVLLFVVIPKGFFPEQDTGVLIGGLRGDQSISFQLMSKKLRQLSGIVNADPAVASVAGFTGGRQTNSGFVFISLKPLAQRHASAAAIVARLRPKLAAVAGAQLFLVPAQDVRAGGRQSNAEYQYTLEGDDPVTLRSWATKISTALKRSPALVDVNSDQQQGGLEVNVAIDRATAARLGLTESAIDNTLYDAFGQRSVSTIYNPLNQYHVIMEVAPRFWQDPSTLREIWISTSGNAASGTSTTNLPAGTVRSSGTAASTTASSVALSSARNQAINAIAASGKSAASSGASVSTSQEAMVPLAAIARFVPGTTPLAVNHQDGQVATTLSFNLPVGGSLSAATTAIRQTMAQLDVPATIHGTFAGTAASYQAAVGNEPIMIVAALAAVYIVLGILYESYVHPITILSTLPSAGVGATLALLVTGMQFTIIALIAVILLIGIVKKNAILMIDFALQAERTLGLNSREAILRASLLRFRPILMTTFAAVFGALPLAIGFGQGSELRRPLGVAIVGGLIVSQILTLYTTPVVYLYLDEARRSVRRRLGIGSVPEAAE